MKVTLFQMNATDDPVHNLQDLSDAMSRAGDCDLFLTPEVTNCVSLDRSHQHAVLEAETQNAFVSGASKLAQKHGCWLGLGSVSVVSEQDPNRFANRSILIDDHGMTRARYDKMHMFDVAVSKQETYQESTGYVAGDTCVVATTPWADIGLTICYDLRFPHLYRKLARSGAKVIVVPAAFSYITGQAHWETLLRARAIETGCYIVAAAQTGTHHPSGRKTHGHSMVVGPWGDVLLDAGTEVGIFTTKLDMNEVDSARARVPSIWHDDVT